MAKQKYDDLIVQLGDLAREVLAESNMLKTMDAVFEVEDEVLARRAELEDLEAEMNGEDEDYQAFLAGQEEEKRGLEATKLRWRSAVIGVEGRSQTLRKDLSSQKAAYRYQKLSLETAEVKHKELELREGHDVMKITTSRENLKRQRLHVMRMARNIEEKEYEFKQVLTPRPGQQGAQGILAHKRLLEMEDEAEERMETHKTQMAELDRLIADKEEEVRAAEEELDAVLFELGEECYAARIPHKELNDLYNRLDVAK